MMQSETGHRGRDREGDAARRTRSSTGTAGSDNYDLVRDLIAQTFPDDFADFNERLFQPGGFYRGNPARERNWKTESGKAQFTAPTTLSALGGNA